MMLLPRGIVTERGRVGTRQAQAPCPQGNGTTIGTAQQFTLLCNTNVDGDVINRPDAFDFNACVDLCSSFHPKCEAISFNENRCLLKNNLQAGNNRIARRFDSAIARFPGATSNCPEVGANQLIGQGTNFGIMCGTIIAGFDIAQNFAPTFQDCMGQCAATNGCAGVSFDASQNDGFKNCYLKTTVTDQSLIVPQLGIDSGLISTAAAVNTGANGATAGAGVTTIPVPQPSTAGAGGGAGAVFFTPPGGSVAVPATDPAAQPAPAATTPAPELAESLIPTTIPSASPTQGLDISDSVSSTISVETPAPGSDSALGNNNNTPATNNNDSGGGGGSNAWIAAPVVGSIAALVLIVLSFIMIKRRRRNGSSSSSAGSSPNISRPSPVSSLFTTWLPSPGRISRGSRSSGGNKMGNFSEVTGQREMSGAGGGGGGLMGKMAGRGSVVGFFRPGGSSMQGMERLDDIEESPRRVGSGEKRESTPVYDLKEGKIELRNSLNGLGQNRWS